MAAADRTAVVRDLVAAHAVAGRHLALVHCPAEAVQLAAALIVAGDADRFDIHVTDMVPAGEAYLVTPGAARRFLNSDRPRPREAL